MLDFLRSLAPRQANALRPAAPLRASASAMPDAGLGADAVQAETEADALLSQAPAMDDSQTRAPRTPDDAIDAPQPGSGVELTQPRNARGMRATRDEASITGRSAIAALPAVDGTSSAFSPASPGPTSPPSVFAMRSDAPLQPVHLYRVDTGGNPEDARPGAVPVIPGAPLSAATVAMAAPDAAASAPQAIHISIDRIDVRAAPAPTPAHSAPPRPRPAVEPQSLHDYLRRKPSP